MGCCEAQAHPGRAGVLGLAPPIPPLEVAAVTSTAINVCPSCKATLDVCRHFDWCPETETERLREAVRRLAGSHAGWRLRWAKHGSEVAPHYYGPDGRGAATGANVENGRTAP